MAGAYCNFCGHRCFVLRWLPDEPASHFATCKRGMEMDRQRTGFDHTTAFNPAIHSVNGEDVYAAYEDWKKQNEVAA